MQSLHRLGGHGVESGRSIHAQHGDPGDRVFDDEDGLVGHGGILLDVSGPARIHEASAGTSGPDPSPRVSVATFALGREPL